MRSNGSYLWYQSWSGSDFPLLPANVDTVKDSPTETRCVSLGASIELTKYVPASECVTSFGVANEAALNDDDLFTLKVIDGQTASAVDFSAGVTEDAGDACLSATRSWKGCVSATETITQSGSSGGNLVLSTAGTLMGQYYGSGDSNVVDGSDQASWTTWAGAMNAREAGSSKALYFSGSTYLASAVSSPIPGIYIQKNTNNSAWTDYSNQLTGFLAYNINFTRDATYFYISYAGVTASGLVRVFRLPLDGSTSDWEAIGVDIAQTTSRDYVMAASSNNVFVTDTSSGLKVVRYTDSTGTWADLGDPLTTASLESHDMLSVGEGMVLIAWTLPSSYQLNVAMYTDAAGWQSVGDFSGVRASDVRIDYVGSTIYVLYKDVENASDMTVKSYTLGSSSTWESVADAVSANGPTIYDFNVIGQTPYILYSHTDSGHTPLICKKYSAE